ncbi:MAG: hypothetical protein MI976_11645 [Pseudomonadales bacterium]|nr:hypothetical protein [Pseudomonadales bacterium]
MSHSYRCSLVNHLSQFIRQADKHFSRRNNRQRSGKSLIGAYDSHNGEYRGQCIASPSADQIKMATPEAGRFVLNNRFAPEA